MDTSESTSEPPGAWSRPLDIVIKDNSNALSGAELAWLMAKGRQAAKSMDVGGEVRATILDDDAMAAAHERWTGHAGPTDVLTSDLAEGDSARSRLLDVDILLGMGEAQRRGAELGHPAVRELLLYLVHGMLHCLGHDDHDPEAFDRMHRVEDEVLTAIGVGPTFAQGPRP